MTLDFTLKKYEELCNVIADSDYTLLTLEEYFSLEKKPEKYIIIRHDVDDEPEYALKMAGLENSLNIKSTYYFRTTENVFKKDIIQKMCTLGHEIGYHYEVLDEASGDYAKAIKIFEKNLEKFQTVCKVKTIAQHGSPLLGDLNATSILGLLQIVRRLLCGNKVFTSWVNVDIWKEYDFRMFGIIGEAYISIDFDKVVYFSDSGMDWNNKYRIKDVVNNADINSKFKIKNTNEIIGRIKRNEVNHIYLLVHPDQWRDNLPDWINWFLLKYIRNSGKMGLKFFARNN